MTCLHNDYFYREHNGFVFNGGSIASSYELETSSIYININNVIYKNNRLVTLDYIVENALENIYSGTASNIQHNISTVVLDNRKGKQLSVTGEGDGLDHALDELLILDGQELWAFLFIYNSTDKEAHNDVTRILDSIEFQSKKD